MFCEEYVFSSSYKKTIIIVYGSQGANCCHYIADVSVTEGLKNVSKNNNNKGKTR